MHLQKSAFSCHQHVAVVRKIRVDFFLDHFWTNFEMCVFLLEKKKQAYLLEEQLQFQWSGDPYFPISPKNNKLNAWQINIASLGEKSFNWKEQLKIRQDKSFE